MKKRIVALLLALVMVLGLVACGQKAPGASPEAAPEATPEAAPEKENEPAKQEDPVKLRLVMYGDLTPRREEYMKGEFHDKVLEDLNIDLTVEFQSWGDKAVTQNMLQAGESFALNYTPAWEASWMTDGLLAEIPMEKIEELCPDYLAMREGNSFQLASYNGSIYLVPVGCKAYAGGQQFLTIRNDILKEVGYNAADITTVDQLLEVYEAVHQKYPNMRVSGDLGIYYRMMGTSFTGELATPLSDYFYVNELEDGDKIYSYFESELFEKQSKFAAMLLEKGYALDDLFTDPGKATADWNNGNAFAKYGAPGHIVETSFKATIPEAEIGRIKISDAPYTMENNYDWGFALSANEAPNLDHWLRLFNWMYKDKETYDFLIYGVEGKDFEYNEDGTINKLVTDLFWEDWFLMANCYMTYDPAVPEENIAIYEATDKDAIISKIAGFRFDNANVSAEMDLLKAVYDEFMLPLALGYVDYDENIDDCVAKLKDAGLDVVMAEYQRQYSEWYAANK